MKFLKSISVGVFTACLAIMTFVSGCKKPVTPVYTVDDAAAAVGSAISNAGGMSAELSGAGSFSAYLYSAACGSVLDTDINNTYTSSAGSFNYHAPWSYAVKCSGNTALLVTIGGSYSGSSNTGLCTASCTGARSFTVTGLGNLSSVYTFNGTYTRKGTQQFSGGAEASNTSTIAITMDNVTVNKTTSQITGGSGTVAINITYDNNNSYVSLTGNIVFNGKGAATLTLLSAAHTYNIKL